MNATGSSQTQSSMDATQSELTNTAGENQTPEGIASNKDETLWATIAHAGTFAGFIIPFGNIVVPLAIYLIKKDESAFIAEHAKESLNFQITLSIASIISFILIMVFIGMITGVALLIVWIVFTIKASMAAHAGGSYRYPYTIRFIK